MTQMPAFVPQVLLPYATIDGSRCEPMHAQYLCEHDRDGVEMMTRDDPNLPPEYEWRECPECGAAAEWDVELDEAAHA